MEGSTSSSIDKILSRVVVNDRGKDSTPREYRRKIHKSVPVHSSFGLETLLSSKIVNYLCLTGDNNSKRMISAADSRIYYCLEELLQASGDSTGPVDGCESARVLAKLYHCDTKFSDIVDSDVQLAKYVVDHRQIKPQADDHNIKVRKSLVLNIFVAKSNPNRSCGVCQALYESKLKQPTFATCISYLLVYFS